jgi:hypothetical protein
MVNGQVVQDFKHRTPHAFRYTITVEARHDYEQAKKHEQTARHDYELEKKHDQTARHDYELEKKYEQTARHEAPVQRCMASGVDLSASMSL